MNKEAVGLLQSNDQLPAKYQDHKLKGTRLRELHIEPDWLLEYQKNDQELILILVDTGSHALIIGM